jgi:hypothetical protein
LIERKLGGQIHFNFFSFSLIFGDHLNFLILACEEGSRNVRGRFFLQFLALEGSRNVLLQKNLSDPWKSPKIKKIEMFFMIVAGVNYYIYPLQQQ